MLVVRAEQFEKIIKHSEEDFVNHLLDYLKNNHSEAIAKYDEATSRKMIRTGIKRAHSNRIEKVEDTEKFIAIMFEVAPNFDNQPEIRAVLDDENLTPDKRLEKLKSPVITEEIWGKARNDYDEKAWFPEQKKPKQAK